MVMGANLPKLPTAIWRKNWARELPEDMCLWFCPQMKRNDKVCDQLTTSIPANSPVSSCPHHHLCSSIRLHYKRENNQFDHDFVSSLSACKKNLKSHNFHIKWFLNTLPYPKKFKLELNGTHFYWKLSAPQWNECLVSRWLTILKA